MRAGLAIVLAALSSLSASRCFAQTCPLPPVLQPLPPGIDIFNDRQEADLGDALAEQIAPRLTIIENDPLTDFLRALGNRLVQHLPPNQLNFRFYLVELPEANAFSIAGGRIYVSRKLIAMVRSEDELAGILAHEMGHIVTHQTGIYMTRRFREVLGVTQVGDRADVFAKFHQYLENYRRKPWRGESEAQEQSAADQVGLFTAFRSGYSPQSFVEILDRLQETHGQTGSWLTDIFGATRPEQRRLREAIRTMGTLPPGCVDARPASGAEAFAKWKDEVVSYSDTGSAEVLPGLLSRTTLKLPLRPDISNLRFSPNGKYLIAQDEGGIHLLTREPLAVLFYIPAQDAHDAEFTPDSQSIVFHNRSLRVETWSIAEQTRSSVHEIVMHESCLQTALSFDGKTLACLSAQSDLVLLDVATSTPFFTKKRFFEPSFAELLSLMLRLPLESDAGWEELELIAMRFSPDDHYFVAGHREEHVALDLTVRKEIPVPGSIRDLIAGGFAFLGPDRMIAIDSGSPDKSPVVRFPSGDRVDRLPLGRQLHLRAAAHGDYLLVGPLREQPLGLMDLGTKNIPISFMRNAADAYDGVMVDERLDGEIALYPVGKKEPIAVITLPQARLGKLRAVAVSPDLECIAISNHSRAALWNVPRNVRVQYTRTFQGAWFASNNLLYADFPKFRESPRAVATLDPLQAGARESYKIGDIVARQQGGFLLVTTPREKNLRWNADVEARDIATDKPVWSRHFPHEVPGLALNSAAGSVLLVWSLAEPGGHDELQAFPDLKSRASREDVLFELVDLHSNGVLGKALVKTNKRSIHLEGSGADGAWAVLTAEGNQILTFSLASGEEKGRYFGTAPVVVAAAGVLAVEKDAKELNLYDLESQQLRRRYVFADPIAVKKMSADGKRLLVMTASQTVYLFDTTTPADTH